MAKKKKSQRKRNFAYSANTSLAPKPQATAKVAAQKTLAPKPVKASSRVTAVHHTGHLKHDIRMIMILALSCVALEIVLWFLLQHTGLGHGIFGN